MYVDCVRECRYKIGFAPKNTFLYCVTEKFKECPFFKTLNKVGSYCEYVDKCPAYRHLGIGHFETFVEITNKYCLSENNLNCERFKLRKAGKEVSEYLLPDGTRLANK